MEIRLARPEELAEIMKLYEYAKELMRQTGNPNQWDAAYPSAEIIAEDIRREQCYLCTEGEELLAVFAFILGEDPTYRVIENGHWTMEAPYGTIHRIASGGKVRGVADRCYEFCRQQIGYIRVDTHRDNRLMRRSLEKNGFRECGIIYVRGESPRIAYDYCSRL